MSDRACIFLIVGSDFFYKHHLWPLHAFLENEGFEVRGIILSSSFGILKNNETSNLWVSDGTRKFVGFSDLRLLFRVFFAVRSYKKVVVHSFMSKSLLFHGALMLLTWLDRSRSDLKCMHTFTGQGWRYLKPKVFRAALIHLELLVATALDKSFVDSSGQAVFLRRVARIFRDDFLEPQMISNGSLLGFENVPVHLKSRNKFRIGFVGRLCRDKGFHVFLEIARRFRERDDVEFVAIGPLDGKNFQEDSFLDIEWMGHLADQNQIWGSLDLLIFPSMREGFGNVIAEAASRGIPVIGCKIYGTRDILKNFVTGMRIENSVESFVYWVERFISDPLLYSTVQKKGRDYVQREFSGKKIQVGYRRIYKELLKC